MSRTAYRAAFWMIMPLLCISFAFWGSWLNCGSVSEALSPDDKKEPKKETEWINGAIFDLYDIGAGHGEIPELMPDQKPNFSKKIDSIDIKGPFEIKDNFLAHIHGILLIQRPGKYRFRLTTDDFGQLTIDGKRIISEDGTWNTAEEGEVTLKRGRHPYLLQWVEGGGAENCRLEWKTPRGRWQVVPKNVLACDNNYDHSTSEGKKKALDDKKIVEHLTREKAIQEAIDDGVEYLLEKTEKQQLAANGRDAEGHLALETYALIVAGVSVEHPAIRANFKHLKKIVLKRRTTYSVSCYIFALDAAISQLEYDFLLLRPELADRVVDHPEVGKQYRKNLKKAVRDLVTYQIPTGGFRYKHDSKDWDNSCTQFAALALGIGAKRGIKIGPKVWLALGNHFIKQQQDKGPVTKLRLTPYAEDDLDNVNVYDEEGEDVEKNKYKKKKRRGRTEVGIPPLDPVVGTEDVEVKCRGWAYTGKGAKWNMVCSGLSSMILVRKYSRDLWKKEQATQLAESIRDGYGWVMENWKPVSSSYYGMYSLEKVANLGGIKKFGEHDWYEVISQHLVENQQKNGSWLGAAHGSTKARVGTAFALLILNRATSLLTMNPAKRVVLTGGNVQEERDLNHEWVYIPELDTCVHSVQLLRTIRLRPQPKILKFAEMIAENYEERFRYKLVPALLDSKSRTEVKAVRQVLDRCLAKVVGSDLGSDKAYRSWHDRVQRAVDIGEKKLVDNADELMQLYREAGESLDLKRRVMHSLKQLNLTRAIPLLIDDLGHKSPRFRLFAYQTIVALAVDKIPAFDAHGTAEDRSQQITELRTWYDSWSARSQG